jgi:hypothetical protein
MKPDLVAPGYTILTALDHPMSRTDTVEVKGTSFSVGVVAGSAALVRQYFQEGWYPLGQKGSGNQINPSGPLVKGESGVESFIHNMVYFN